MKLKTAKQIPIGGKIVEAGNSKEFKTGSWKAKSPVWDKEKCINCMKCVVYCPDMAIKTKKIASLVCIQDLWSEDKATNALLYDLKRRGFLCLQVYRNPCYRIKLDCSYDEYLKKTKSSRRQRELIRNEKKLFELGKVDIQRYTGSEITFDIVSRMADIQKESWMKRRGAALLCKSFHKR